VTGSAFLGVERSLGGKKWRSRIEDDRLAGALAQKLGVPEVVGRILAGRNVGLDEAEAWFRPTLRTWLPDPSSFLDMDRAAARVADAIQKGDAIAVFGDYDVDGATSSALLRRFLRAVGSEPVIYIPDRMREGYGPNEPAMRKLAAQGVRIVITVDCGTLSYGPLSAAREAGLEVIVIDHHIAEPRLPDAFAVVNPNRVDESGAHRQVAAVGMAYMLVVAVNRELRQRDWYANRDEPDLLQWLDLVAVGTICDVVALTGVNRALVAQGLKVIARRANPGLRALADVAGLNELPGAYHCGFLLGPRVNAGGRVGQADLGMRLLSTDDPAEAAALAQQLNFLNRERQEIEAGVLAEALMQAEQRASDPVVIVAGEGWHPGVIGIVAARVREAVDRPAIVIAMDGGKPAKGSGRSMPGVDLGAAVTAALQAGLLINGGGHPMAAGVTLAPEGIEPLRAFLCERLAPHVDLSRASGSMGVDGALAVSGATSGLLDLLDQAGPYGSGNPEPRFVLPGARVVKADVAGGKHVRCILSDASGTARLKAIAFRMLEGSEVGPALLQSGGLPLHLAGHLRADNWRGERRVQFVIEDAAKPS
jgi:single-stranded-DNA-specific exonuclease